MVFRILHISDIHFSEESTSNWVKRREILKRIMDENLCADCLIISGDLFHRGFMESNKANECKKDLSDLLTALGDQCALLVAPGNHDVDRRARKEKSGEYNIYIYREDIVRRAGVACQENGEYSINDNAEKEVLYQNAFSSFQRFSQNISSVIYHTPDASMDVDNYELQRWFLRNTTNSGAVQLVFLNTALFAGQSVRGDEYIKRKNEKEKEYREKVNSQEIVEAAELALSMAKEQETYEKYCEIIVDEENQSDTHGRLGLSRDGNRHLSQSIISQDEHGNRDIVCTLFVGHHGFEYLSQQTQKAIVTAMNNCRCGTDGVYLCGHAHKARHREIPITDGDDLSHIHQAQAGVMFGKDDGFAEYSFNYITIDDSGANPLISGMSHYYVKRPSGKKGWYKEEIFAIQQSGRNLQHQEMNTVNDVSEYGDDKVPDSQTKRNSAQPDGGGGANQGKKIKSERDSGRAADSHDRSPDERHDNDDKTKAQVEAKPKVPSMDEMLEW